MKIGQPSDNPVSVNANASAVPSKGGQSSTASAVAIRSTQSDGVAVTMSTLARTLEASTRDETTDVDMEKVASVRTAIKQGTFVVNPGVIADKLLTNALEMLNRTRG